MKGWIRKTYNLENGYDFERARSSLLTLNDLEQHKPRFHRGGMIYKLKLRNDIRIYLYDGERKVILEYRNKEVEKLGVFEVILESVKDPERKSSFRDIGAKVSDIGGKVVDLSKKVAVGVTRLSGAVVKCTKKYTIEPDGCVTWL